MASPSATSQIQKVSNRRDHYIPRGYLRGFIAPERLKHQRPLWYLDVPNGVWLERSPREIAYRRGFYDYVAKRSEVKPPTRASPNLRACIRESGIA